MSLRSLQAAIASCRTPGMPMRCMAQAVAAHIQLTTRSHFLSAPWLVGPWRAAARRCSLRHTCSQTCRRPASQLHRQSRARAVASCQAQRGGWSVPGPCSQGRWGGLPPRRGCRSPADWCFTRPTHAEASVAGYCVKLSEPSALREVVSNQRAQPQHTASALHRQRRPWTCS